jgi:hypothetical protein
VSSASYFGGVGDGVMSASSSERISTSGPRPFSNLRDQGRGILQFRERVAARVLVRLVVVDVRLAIDVEQVLDVVRHHEKRPRDRLGDDESKQRDEPERFLHARM